MIHQWKGLHDYYNMETEKSEEKKSKLNLVRTPSVCTLREEINISPTLVIDTSTERSSRELQHRNQKKMIFFLSLKLNLTCAEELKSAFK